MAVGGINATRTGPIDIDLDFKQVDAENTYFPGSEDRGVLLHRRLYGAFQRIQPVVDQAMREGIKMGSGLSLSPVIPLVSVVSSEGMVGAG